MSLPIVACVLLLTVLASSQFVNGCYTSIFAFGDSIIDTGNYISLISKGLLQYDEIPNCSTPPYGETFFHHPTGRCSDGRLIIDFIAEHYGLPLLPPYSGGGNANPGGGVNFAVIGAPALTDDVLQADWSYSRDNISMMSQINMFKSLLPSICKTSSCDEIFDKSLIIFGSFGSNDYAPTMLSKRVEDAYRLQPLIVNAIGSAIEELIKLGVVNIMVPGMLPVGCLAGFNNETGVIACCGSGGPYNAEGDTKCGYPSSHACNDPSSYIEWDGAHLTQAANRWIARGLLSGLYTSPNITASCSTSTSAMWI
ncbi:PREDICTED: GDSL esterase/lipase At2g27360-like isoform X2 [Ipomoea nil]|uniref:GDSL esterase/lipase At2g27360-like isoform X2 n=1 Tax=Ipomoea nil TaxID=35883 RepID=UPI000901FD1F|nr:PREDICTED: GDSL esterase/lipase At2g27360-like isoform X2 [Ipomoea nil]